jgi:large subunit ribosomal protein L10
MGMNRSEKVAMVENIGAVVADAESIVLAEYRGLEVDAITALRREARGAGVHLRVLKNSLARRAVAGTPFEKLSDQMYGPLIYGISTDPVAAARVLHTFAKGNQKLVLKGGAMRNSIMDTAAVTALASLPSREELLAKLLGTMQAPVAQFVRTLNEVPARFVRTLAAVEKSKAEAA